MSNRDKRGSPVSRVDRRWSFSFPQSREVRLSFLGSVLKTLRTGSGSRSLPPWDPSRGGVLVCRTFHPCSPNDFLRVQDECLLTSFELSGWWRIGVRKEKTPPKRGVFLLSNGGSSRHESYLMNRDYNGLMNRDYDGIKVPPTVLRSVLSLCC